MLAVIQRVKEASVEVDGTIISKINHGLLILAGIEKSDTSQDLEYCAKKSTELRIFEDAEGKMNLSVQDTAGEILAVSQFTLAGDIRKGRRPSFDTAMPPAEAEKLFGVFVEQLKSICPKVQTGSFGAHMKVSLVNDGPVTFIIDSRKRV